MAASEEREQVEQLRRRLEAMGLEVRLAPGGHSVLARVPLGDDPLPTLGRSLSLPVAVVSSVGPNRVKCLAPRPLFQLPLVSIADCASAEAIARRIRQAWADRMSSLGRTRGWLEKLGVAVDDAGEEGVIRFPVGSEDPDARASAATPGQVILPGRGTLSGLALQRAEDRVFQPDPAIDSSVDLELAIAARSDELARLDARLAREARQRAARTAPPPDDETDEAAHRPRLLLVGAQLTGHPTLAQALRVRGFEVGTAKTAAEALRAFESVSFELVLTDADLGRYEGIELIPTIRALPGIEELPVVLVDDRNRSERRDVARRVGAAGYLVHPLDLARIERGLARLARKPRRRRYTRYAARVGVRHRDGAAPEGSRQLGRGGMLLATDRELAIGQVEHCALSLPGDPEPLRVDAEVLYRIRSAGRGGAAGMRFRAFPDGGEQRLISWLLGQEGPAGA